MAENWRNDTTGIQDEAEQSFSSISNDFEPWERTYQDAIRAENSLLEEIAKTRSEGLASKHKVFEAAQRLLDCSAEKVIVAEAKAAETVFSTDLRFTELMCATEVSKLEIEAKTAIVMATGRAEKVRAGGEDLKRIFEHESNSKETGVVKEWELLQREANEAVARAEWRAVELLLKADEKNSNSQQKISQLRDICTLETAELHRRVARIQECVAISSTISTARTAPLNLVVAQQTAAELGKCLESWKPYELSDLPHFLSEQHRSLGDFLTDLMISVGNTVDQLQQPASPGNLYAVGSTGSGKSTFLAYLLGHKLQLQPKIGKDGKEELDFEGNPVMSLAYEFEPMDVAHPIIGQRLASETQGIYIYSALGHEVIDCAGSRDTGGTLIDMCNAVSLSLATESRPPSRMLVLLKADEILVDSRAGGDVGFALIVKNLLKCLSRDQVWKTLPGFIFAINCGCSVKGDPRSPVDKWNKRLKRDLHKIIAVEQEEIVTRIQKKYSCIAKQDVVFGFSVRPVDGTFRELLDKMSTEHPADYNHIIERDLIQSLVAAMVDSVVVYTTLVEDIDTRAKVLDMMVASENYFPPGAVSPASLYNRSGRDIKFEIRAILAVVAQFFSSKVDEIENLVESLRLSMGELRTLKEDLTKVHIELLDLEAGLSERDPASSEQLRTALQATQHTVANSAAAFSAAFDNVERELHTENTKLHSLQAEAAETISNFESLQQRFDSCELSKKRFQIDDLNDELANVAKKIANMAKRPPTKRETELVEKLAAIHEIILMDVSLSQLNKSSHSADIQRYHRELAASSQQIGSKEVDERTLRAQQNDLLNFKEAEERDLSAQIDALESQIFVTDGEISKWSDQIAKMNDSHKLEKLDLNSKISNLDEQLSRIAVDPNNIELDSELCAVQNYLVTKSPEEEQRVKAITESMNRMTVQCETLSDAIKETQRKARECRRGYRGIAMMEATASNPKLFAVVKAETVIEFRVKLLQKLAKSYPFVFDLSKCAPDQAKLLRRSPHLFSADPTIRIHSIQEHSANGQFFDSTCSGGRYSSRYVPHLWGDGKNHDAQPHVNIFLQQSDFESFQVDLKSRKDSAQNLDLEAAGLEAERSAKVASLADSKRERVRATQDWEVERRRLIKRESELKADIVQRDAAIAPVAADKDKLERQSAESDRKCRDELSNLCRNRDVFKNERDSLVRKRDSLRVKKSTTLLDIEMRIDDYEGKIGKVKSEVESLRQQIHRYTAALDFLKTHAQLSADEIQVRTIKANAEEAELVKQLQHESNVQNIKYEEWKKELQRELEQLRGLKSKIDLKLGEIKLFKVEANHLRDQQGAVDTLKAFLDGEIALLEKASTDEAEQAMCKSDLAQKLADLKLQLGSATTAVTTNSDAILQHYREIYHFRDLCRYICKIGSVLRKGFAGRGDKEKQWLQFCGLFEHLSVPHPFTAKCKAGHEMWANTTGRPLLVPWGPFKWVCDTCSLPGNSTCWVCVTCDEAKCFFCSPPLP